jgi:D-glycero-alpha-D-manno-heptose-7-phosphate kinase
MDQDTHPSSHVATRARFSTNQVAERGTDEVVAVAPLRIDLTGGFTDVLPFSRTIDSLHVNATIGLSATVSCRVIPEGQLRIEFPDESRASEGRWRFINAISLAVKDFASNRGMHLKVRSEAPAGSGLGSSGAILVAAICACAKQADVELTRYTVAERAVSAAAAADILGGKQDEFAAAYGSCRGYLFQRDSSASVLQSASEEMCRHLEQHLLIVQFSPGGRSADIVTEVSRAARNGERATLEALSNLQDLASQLYESICTTDPVGLRRVFCLIREAQQRLNPRICSPNTARALTVLRSAIPGLEYKFLGGGGNGACVLLYVPTDQRHAALGLIPPQATKVFPVKIDHRGVTSGLLNSDTIAR